MHLSQRLLGLAMYLACAGATPLPSDVITTPNGMSPDVIFTVGPENSVNDCGDSSFENKSSSASPSVNDCLQITYNIAGGGTWHQGGESQRQLVSYGSCALGVQSGASQPAYKVGNQDIIDIIHSSIDRFQWNGLVGARGNMPCQRDDGFSGSVDVTWGLYHT
jgi:hypothetical protein